MKALRITPEMQARINAAAGVEVPPDTILAYEAVAYTRDPVHKPGSIFNGSTADPALYSEMAAFVNGGKSVTLQLMHQTDDRPSGRVFYAAETPEGLRAQFYVPKTKEVTNDIDNGLLADVSVGMLAKQLLCSKCQFDYRGPESSIMNLIDQTCGEGHVIGQDGAHLVAKGLDTWFELSLCGTGASPGAKVVARSKAMLSQDSLQRLAASGVSPEAVILVTPPTHKQEDSMDLKVLTDKVAEQATEVARLTQELATAKTTKTADDAAIADLTAKLAAADAVKVDLETKLTAAQTASGAHASVVADLTAAKTFLKEMAQRGIIASGGKADAVVPDSITELVASIKASGLALANLVAHQHAHDTRTDKKTGDGATGVPSSAFKTR